MITTTLSSGHVVSELPEVVQQVATGRVISLYKFLKRFTFPEMVAVLSAAKTDPIVEAVMLLMRSTKDQDIDLDDPQTVGGIDTLIAKLLISPERKAQILA